MIRAKPCRKLAPDGIAAGVMAVVAPASAWVAVEAAWAEAVDGAVEVVAVMAATAEVAVIAAARMAAAKTPPTISRS